jgi:hypothetical protein
MVTHMKTTVTLPDELVKEAQALARRDHTTLRELIETGLRAVVAQRSTRSTFTLPDAAVDGRGLQSAFQGSSWAQIRDAIYESPA